MSLIVTRGFGTSGGIQGEMVVLDVEFILDTEEEHHLALEQDMVYEVELLDDEDLL